jgi:hypothetical protein
MPQPHQPSLQQERKSQLLSNIEELERNREQRRVQQVIQKIVKNIMLNLHHF